MPKKHCLIALLGFFFAACGTSEQPKPPEPFKPVEQPIPPPVSQAVDGKTLYEEKCSACHGVSGKGDGPAAVSPPKKPANLTDDKTKKKSNEELAQIISEGRPEKSMPPWKNTLKEEEIKAVVKYLRELGKK